MLAWHTVMKTPQYPEGREVVVIANDVTVQSGETEQDNTTQNKTTQTLH